MVWTEGGTLEEEGGGIRDDGTPRAVSTQVYISLELWTQLKIDILCVRVHDECLQAPLLHRIERYALVKTDLSETRFASCSNVVAISMYHVSFLYICSMQAPRRGQTLFVMDGEELIPLTYINNQIVEGDRGIKGVLIILKSL